MKKAKKSVRKIGGRRPAPRQAATSSVISGKVKFWKAQKDAFTSAAKSFTGKVFWKAAAFDVLAVLVIMFVGMTYWAFANNLLVPLVPELQRINALQDLDDPSYQYEFVQLAPLVNTALTNAAVLIIVGFVACVFAQSILSGKAWSLIQGSKLTNKYARRLFIFSIFWYIFWLTIIYLAAVAFSDSVIVYAFFILMLIWMISEFIFRSFFSEDISMLRLFGKTMVYLVAKIHWLLPMAAVTLAVGLLALMLLGLLTGIMWLFAPLTIIFALLIFGFARSYTVQVLKIIS